MSTRAEWQIASAAILLLALAGGAAWFERERPAARVVATIAVLAALDVVGRIAFAALPNVKPTTDIAIVAGFALGASPGFMVGALTALVSNFYFAQGPWTPWQMAAWGACGLFGAILARVSRGRMGRLPMAACCAAAGLAFGAVMNFGSAVNLGGAGVGTGFIAYSVQSLPFDVAHAAGNFAFYLLAGPVLLRMLMRSRDRAEVVWPQAAQRAAS